MTTTTARYALTKLNTDGSDTINVVTDFNNNTDALDLRLGFQVSTSSTRPSSPGTGYTTFETDTKFSRVYNGSAWQTAGNAVATSGARPANPIQGDEFYETDTGYTRSRGSSAWNGILPSLADTSQPANPIAGDLFYASNIDAVIRYTGSAWKITSIIPCTSSTRPTANLAAGVAAYETDTKRFIVYSGSAWEQKAFANFVCTSSTHPASPFTGLEIYETDSGLSAVYNGTGYEYSMQQIAPTQVLLANTASITFTGISGLYTRLMLFWRGRSDTTGPFDILMQLDANTGSNYLWTKNEESNGTQGSSHGGAATTSIKIGVIGAGTTSYFASGHQTIDGWANSTGFATTVGPYTNFGSTTTDWAGVAGGQFNVVGPHSSVKVLPSSGNLAPGSQISLYAGM